MSNFGGVPVRKVSERRPFLKGLVYGEPGSGKTHLASQASKVPAMSPCLYITPDESESDTLFNSAPEAEHAGIKNWQEIWDIYNELAKYIRDPDKIPYKTAVIDTGTELERMWMRDIMTEVLEKGRPGGGEVNIDVPSLREWGMSSSGMRRVIRSFRDLPLNFIVNCHSAENRDNRGVSWLKPDFPGKLKNQAAGMFSSVWYLYVIKQTEEEVGAGGRRRQVTVGETRCLLTGFTEGFVCKTRVGTLPRVIPNPDMRMLFEAVTGRDGVTGERVFTPAVSEETQPSEA